MSKNNKKSGQSMIEYLLMISAVIIVLLYVVAPGGIYTTTINESLETSIEGINSMMLDVDY